MSFFLFQFQQWLHQVMVLVSIVLNQEAHVVPVGMPDTICILKEFGPDKPTQNISRLRKVCIRFISFYMMIHMYVTLSKVSIQQTCPTSSKVPFHTNVSSKSRPFTGYRYSRGNRYHIKICCTQSSAMVIHVTSQSCFVILI